MSVKTFRYNYKERLWQMTSSGEIWEKPVVIIGNISVGDWDVSYFRCKDRFRAVWCEEHGSFEKVRHIERIDSIRTVAGCRKKGFVAAFSYRDSVEHYETFLHGLDEWPCKARLVTAVYAWQVTLLCDGNVEVRADAVRFWMRGEGKTALDFHITPHHITLKEIFYPTDNRSSFIPRSKDWWHLEIDIPPEVTEAAFSLLSRSLPNPSYIPTAISGCRKLRAFIRRPLDSSIVYWESFFSEKNFEKDFPKDSADNFTTLCCILELKPTTKLREGYERNPYAPLWSKLLLDWGLKDESARALFYDLTSFAGVTPQSLHWDNEEKRIVPCKYYWEREPDYTPYSLSGMEATQRICLLSWYVPWALTQTRELTFAKHGLYALATKPWTAAIKEELDYFNTMYYPPTLGCCPEHDMTEPLENLSPASKHHLLGFNTEWLGHHWLIEHDRLMEELYGLRQERKREIRGENDEDNLPLRLSRKGRVLRLYDAILTNSPIHINSEDWPKRMKQRDYSDIRRFCALYEEVKESHALEDDLPHFDTLSRLDRLLLYRKILDSCGYITQETIAKITGENVSRRTFMRDVEIIRKACVSGYLKYSSKDEKYVWESYYGD